MTLQQWLLLPAIAVLGPLVLVLHAIAGIMFIAAMVRDEVGK